MISTATSPASNCRGPAPTQVPLLGCACGEWGCWPLIATITIAYEVVEWSSLHQPHRPGRDYTGFGPFRFAEPAYRSTIRATAHIAGDAADGDAGHP